MASQSGQPPMSHGTLGHNNTAGSHLAGSSPLVMPVFPLRSSHSAHTPNYSAYSPSRYFDTNFMK